MFKFVLPPCPKYKVFQEAWHVVNFLENMIATTESFSHLIDFLHSVLPPAFLHVYHIIGVVCVFIVGLRPCWTNEEEAFDSLWVMAGV